MRKLLPPLLIAPALLLGSHLAPAGATLPSMVESGHEQANVAVQAPFTLATFNVLGHSHTAPGGNKSGFESGTTRIRLAVEALNGHDVDVVGFQEFEEIQRDAFLDEVRGAWGVWHEDDRNVRNSIAWRKSTFDFVRGETILIPYFLGALREMPYVLLEHKASGQQMWFANFHLPANSGRPGNEEAYRDQGTQKHIDLAHELRNTGQAVFFTGDMNEKEEYFCTFTANGDMHASNGGSNDGGRCLPPQRPNRTRIDWIFGSQGAQFSDYFVDESALVQRISDHPLVLARVY